MLGKKTSLLVGVLLWSTASVFCGGKHSKQRTVAVAMSSSGALSLGDVYAEHPDLFLATWVPSGGELFISLNEELKNSSVSMALDDDTLIAIAFAAGVQNCRSVKALYLKNNRLQSIEAFCFPALEQLHLSGNKIRFFGRLAEFTQLSVLRLEGNGLDAQAQKQVQSQVPENCWVSFEYDHERTEPKVV